MGLLPMVQNQLLQRFDTFKPEWDEAEDYAIGDEVFYKGRYWRKWANDRCRKRLAGTTRKLRRAKWKMVAGSKSSR